MDDKFRIQLLKSINKVFGKEYYMVLHADGSGTIEEDSGEGVDWGIDWLGEDDMMDRIIGWVANEKLSLIEFEKENK